MQNYSAIATDLDIIEQKIESLRGVLKTDDEKAQKIELALWQALNAIQEAKAEI